MVGGGAPFNMGEGGATTSQQVCCVWLCLGGGGREEGDILEDPLKLADRGQAFGRACICGAGGREEGVLLPPLSTRDMRPYDRPAGVHMC